jgi:hypothetical protein
MSTDDTRRNESIASTNHNSQRQFLGAAAALDTLPNKPPVPSEPKAAISDDLAAQIAVEQIEPALRDLTKPDRPHAEAIPKLERAISQLRQGTDRQADHKISGSCSVDPEPPSVSK